MASIISPSCFQFLSNKNIGNVILFALQIKHLDSLLNIFINLKDCKGFSLINQAQSRHTHAHAHTRTHTCKLSERRRRVYEPQPLRSRVPSSVPAPPPAPVSWPCVPGRSDANGLFVLQNPIGLGNRSASLSFVPYLIRKPTLVSLTGTSWARGCPLGSQRL